MSDDELLHAARDARRRAHAPYSGFLVGAAVIDEHGAVHVGCNVENASYPEGICAEANAIGSMVAAGGRRIRSIAVVGAPASGDADPVAVGTSCMPCGGCRQRFLEFADADTRILCCGSDGTVSRGVDELLPESFGPPRP